MAETYSIGLTGSTVDDLPFLPDDTVVPDSAATTGGLQLAMQQGRQVLCKNSDGSFSWYTIDPVYSTPGNPRLYPV